MQEIKILYEDEELIVCVKPAGVATQTKRLGERDMESLLRNHAAEEQKKAGRTFPYIGIVHRLDQPVEGVMVFAKTKQAAASLCTQVQNRSFGKKYYAWVELPVDLTFSEKTKLPPEGILEDWIQFDRRQNLSRIVEKKEAQAKPARLSYRVVREEKGQALMDIHLDTGRHHQIRVQLAHAGIPILGDRRYGGTTERKLMLCSYHIDFEHPKDGRRMCFEHIPKEYGRTNLDKP